MFRELKGKSSRGYSSFSSAGKVVAVETSSRSSKCQESDGTLCSSVYQSGDAPTHREPGGPSWRHRRFSGCLPDGETQPSPSTSRGCCHHCIQQDHSIHHSTFPRAFLQVLCSHLVSACISKLSLATQREKQKVIKCH